MVKLHQIHILMKKQKLTTYINMKNIAFITLSIIIWACGGKKEEIITPQKVEIKTVAGIARIEPESKLVQLSSEVSGTIANIYVSAGDTVKKGDTLVILSYDVEKAQYNQALSSVSVLENDINTQNAAYEIAVQKMNYAKQKYDRLFATYQNKAETKQNVDNAENEYLTAKYEVDRIKSVSNSSKLQVLDSKNKANILKVQLQKKIICAPEDGVILTMDLNRGKTVTTSTVLMDFAPLGNVYAICEIDEMYAHKVKVNQKAIIKNTNEKGDTLATGVVVASAPYLKRKSLFNDGKGDLEDRRVREVKVKVNNPEGLLFGMRTECVITIQ